jgi:hypothetical protein
LPLFTWHNYLPWSFFIGQPHSVATVREYDHSIGEGRIDFREGKNGFVAIGCFDLDRMQNAAQPQYKMALSILADPRSN